jgi:hypothetical protein
VAFIAHGETYRLAAADFLRGQILGKPEDVVDKINTLLDEIKPGWKSQ